MTGDGGPDGGRGPIEAATTELTGWLERITGASVAIRPPADSDAAEPTGAVQDGLVLWPLELRAERQTHNTGQRAPYPFRITYLLTIAEPLTVSGSLRDLDTVLVAAVQAGEPAISLDPPDPRLWQALGVRPRPALLIDVPAQIVRPPRKTPLVLHPLQVKHMQVRPLEGQVLGPGDIPVAGMRVEVAGTSVVAYTDAYGQFHLAGVPADTPVRLRLRGRNRSLVAQVDPDLTEPLIIHCTFEES